MKPGIIIGWLKHTAATLLVEQFGWDVARIVLEHRQVSTMRIYALDDVSSVLNYPGQQPGWLDAIGQEDAHRQCLWHCTQECRPTNKTALPFSRAADGPWKDLGTKLAIKAAQDAPPPRFSCLKENPPQ